MQTTFSLHVYRAPSGQIAGRLLEGDSVVFAVAGCSTVIEVEEAAIDAGYEEYELLTDLPNE